MAECKWCHRSGWLLSVTNIGVCKSCNSIIALDFVQRTRIIEESLRLIDTSKSLDTRLSRCDLVISQAAALVKYEERGIGGMRPRPSELVQEYESTRDSLILAGLHAEYEAAKSKASIAATPRTKITTLSKFLLTVRDFKGKASNPHLLDDLEREVADLVNRSTLQGYLDAAERLAFKGQNKKALDQYYEALYFLRHDDVDDALQAAQIADIEMKIQALGGELKRPEI